MVAAMMETPETAAAVAEAAKTISRVQPRPRHFSCGRLVFAAASGSARSNPI
jgi:hypothetical protein